MLRPTVSGVRGQCFSLCMFERNKQRVIKKLWNIKFESIFFLIF